MRDTIRSLIAQHGRLSVSIETIGDDQDLYSLGLTSFAAVQLLLALEDRFDVEFPETMLNRRSFASIAAVSRCVDTLASTTVG